MSLWDGGLGGYVWELALEAYTEEIIEWVIYAGFKYFLRRLTEKMHEKADFLGISELTMLGKLYEWPAK